MEDSQNNKKIQDEVNSILKDGLKSPEQPKEEKVEKPEVSASSKKEQPQKKSSIRTYADDVARLIKGGASLSDIALSEQKRRVGSKKNVRPETSSGGLNKIAIFVAVILIVLGLIVLVGSIFLGKDDQEKPADTAQNITSIIFANSKEEVSLEGLERIEALKKINQSRSGVELPLGAIGHLYLTRDQEGSKTLLGARNFLKLIGIRAGDSFIRALEEEYMLGVHSFDGNQGFILFKIKSFDNALSEIIGWEKFILDDLWPMFYSQRPDVNLDSVSAFQGEFKDVVLRNRDVRVLEDEKGETALVYSFPDRRHLIITTDKSTLIEVFDRLTTGRLQN